MPARGGMELLPKLTLLFILIGIAFSGYLGGNSLSGTCPIGGACPYFLGYPACFYGLAMYSALLVVFLLSWKGRLAKPKALLAQMGIAGLGVLFAASLLVQEVLIDRPIAICAMGLVMYGAIFVLSWRQRAAAGA